MKSRYPFSFGDIWLPLPEHAGQERDILVAIPVAQRRSDTFLFAQSGDVKSELQSRLTRFKTNGSIHPNALELAATIACLTFFERLHCNDPQNGSPKPIENDNWNSTYWAFIKLFESDRGFIARLDDSQQFRVFNTAEPLESTTYRVADLKMTMLTDDSGKSYSTNDGETLLEYVDRI